MGNYNFEDDNNSWGETIRIDHINNEVQKHKYINKKIEDDIDETRAGGQHSSQVKKMRKPRMIEDDYRKVRKGNGDAKRGRGFWIFAIVLGVAMFFVVFYAVFASINDSVGKISDKNTSDSSNGSDSSGALNNKNKDLNDFVGLVKNVGSSKEISFFDIVNNKTIYVKCDESTEIQDEDNNELRLSDLNIGDIVSVKMDKEKNIAEKIDFSSEAWSKKNIKNVSIDTKSKSIKTEDESYKFTEDTVFIYNDKLIESKDLETSDILTLKGYEKNVWCILVQEYHGYINIKNKETIKDGIIQIDNIEASDINDFDKIPVSSGAHKIIINGSNIETFSADVYVAAGDTYEIDLSNTQAKTGVIAVAVNVDGYKLLINNEEVKDTSKPIVLSHGEYSVEVTKDGYESYKETIVLDKPSVKVNVELKEKIKIGKLTIASQPSSAYVYLDGEYIGVAPVLKEIPYGEHRIVVKKDGYKDISAPITIKSSDEYLNIVLKPINDSKEND